MVGLVDRILTLRVQASNAKTNQDLTVILRQIGAIDEQIDHFVYELYSLSSREIKLVEEILVP
jgi:hypothetical protein